MLSNIPCFPFACDICRVICTLEVLLIGQNQLHKLLPNMYLFALGGPIGVFIENFSVVCALVSKTLHDLSWFVNGGCGGVGTC